MSVDPIETSEAVPRGSIVGRDGQMSRAFRNWLERGNRQQGKVISGIAQLDAAIQVTQGLVTGIEGQLGAYYALSVDVGGNGAFLKLSDNTAFGSAISLSANEITLDADAINFGAQTEFDTATETFITEAGGVRTRYGSPFGASSDLLRWYGPTSVPQGSETRTNGYLTEGTDGVVRFGAAALNWGATAAESAASNDYAPFGGNRLYHTRFNKFTGFYAATAQSGSPGSFTQAVSEGLEYLRFQRNAMTAGTYIYLSTSPQASLQPCAGGQIVYAAAVCTASGCDEVRAFLTFLDASLNIIPGQPLGAPITTNLTTALANRQVRPFVKAQAPSNARFVQLGVRARATGGTQTLFFAEPQLCFLPNINSAAPPYEEGRDYDEGADPTIDNTAGDIVSGVIQNTQVSQTAGALTLSNNTWTTCASFSFTSVGIGVELRGTCKLRTQNSFSGGTFGDLEWRLLRDATVLKSAVASAPLQSDGSIKWKEADIVADYNDIPSSGTYTYALQVRVNVTDGDVPLLTGRAVSLRYLSAREFRR